MIHQSATVVPSSTQQRRKKRRRNAVCASMISETLRKELLALSFEYADEEMKGIDGEEKFSTTSACGDKPSTDFQNRNLIGHMLHLNQTKSYRTNTFDIHEFAKLATDKYVLPAIAMSIFYDLDANRGGMFHKLNINAEKLQNYLVDIATKYVSTNCFHNSIHAADVGQTIYSLLYNNPNLLKRLSDLDQFTLLLSAFVHDVAHNGTNNDFLIKTLSPLALRYNDQSVLENFHISTAWEVITLHERNNFMENMTLENKMRFRKLLIKVILATDNSKHFEKLMQLNNMKFSGINVDTDLYNNKDFIMEILLHASDISNPAKSYKIYGQWVDRIMEEFYLLGDLEKRNNLPITEIFKRGKSRATVQHGFLKYFVQPLFKSIEENIDGVNVTKLLQNIQSNMDHWEKLMENENV